MGCTGDGVIVGWVAVIIGQERCGIEKGDRNQCQTQQVDCPLLEKAPHGFWKQRCSG
jgi:hypothetical protein